MATTNEQRRSWGGPAVFSYGFRPFFLAAAGWAALTMLIWILSISGVFAVAPVTSLTAWHAHELAFGYLSAAIAGFLLTAVPNWTGRLPVVGWPLMGLFGLWLAGRLAILELAFFNLTPWIIVAGVALSMPVLLAVLLAREILTAKNWHNLPVLGVLILFILGNVLFLFDLKADTPAEQGIGLRLGLSGGLMLVALIGGRIVPSFTRNWLVPRGIQSLPSPPMQRFDKLALVILGAALAVWVIWPGSFGTGCVLLIAGIAHATRLSRWQGHRTLAEPLLWVLHVAYALLPIGAALLGGAILFPDLLGQASAQHVWMAGALGLMTLAVMTRASLGHTGQALHAGAGTTLLYLLLLASVFLRVAAGIWLEGYAMLISLSGITWIAAFAGFAVLYGPLLWRKHP